MKSLLVLVLSSIFCSLVSGQSSHPQLFIGSSDISTLQSRATTSGTKAYELWTQIIKSREADWFRDNPGAKAEIIRDPWQMENLYAVALAYIITSDASYFNATKDMIFGYTPPGGTPITGIVNAPPFDHPGYFDQFHYRVAQVTTLSMVTDLLWDQLTYAQRTLIVDPTARRSMAVCAITTTRLVTETLSAPEDSSTSNEGSIEYEVHVCCSPQLIDSGRCPEPISDGITSHFGSYWLRY